MSTTLEHFNIVNQQVVSPETTVMLVGTALDGPSGVPFQLKKSTDPYEALGFSPLAQAYDAARRVGAGTILAYRINGMPSTAVIKDMNNQEIVSFKTVSSSEIYNGISMILFPDHLYITNTTGTTRSYFFDKYPTVRDLVYGINRDAFYGLVEFQAESINEYTKLLNLVSNPTDVIFSGGQSESQLIHSRNPLSNDHSDSSIITPIIKTKIETALFGEDSRDVSEREPSSELGILPYGVIVLCDIFHDDTIHDATTNTDVNAGFTEMLGAFCLNKTKEAGKGCIGVIGTRPIYPDTADDPMDFNDVIHQRAVDLLNITGSIQDTEAYKYVQVIVGHTYYPQSSMESISLAYAYGATEALLPYNTIMSNKSIVGVTKLNYEMTKEDVALLSANGYTCIVPSIRKGFVPYYSVSYTKDTGSLTSRPHNIRISQYVSAVLTEELDSLIGSEYTNLSVKNAIDGANQLLNELVDSGVIKDYGLDYGLDDTNTILSVDASLTPISEITAIHSIATLSFPREVTY